MPRFVIVHDVYGTKFLLNLDRVDCFRSEKGGKCSAKLSTGYVVQLNSSLADVERCLDEMDTDKKEEG